MKWISLYCHRLVCCLYVCLHVCLPACPSVCLPFFLSVCLSVYKSINVCVSACVCVRACLCMCLCMCAVLGARVLFSLISFALQQVLPPARRVLLEPTVPRSVSGPASRCVPTVEPENEVHASMIILSRCPTCVRHLLFVSLIWSWDITSTLAAWRTFKSFVLRSSEYSCII